MLRFVTGEELKEGMTLLLTRGGNNYSFFKLIRYDEGSSDRPHISTLFFLLKPLELIVKETLPPKKSLISLMATLYDTNNRGDISEISNKIEDYCFVDIAEAGGESDSISPYISVTCRSNKDGEIEKLSFQGGYIEPKSQVKIVKIDKADTLIKDWFFHQGSFKNA